MTVSTTCGTWAGGTPATVTLWAGGAPRTYDDEILCACRTRVGRFASHVDPVLGEAYHLAGR